MNLLKEYGDYWPVFVGSLLFGTLGLWFCRAALNASELMPKPLDWVRNYRSGGYPFSKDRLGSLRLQPAFMVLLFASLGFAFYASYMVARFLYPDLQPSFLSYYNIFSALLRIVGGGAVYLLLQLLLHSPRAALPGALLFAASSVRGHSDACLLALCLLPLLLYLPAQPGKLRGELLYLLACLLFAPLLALRPAMIWLLVWFPAVHWYKLGRMQREGQLSRGRLLGFAVAALSVWGIALLLTVLLRCFLLTGFRMKPLLLWLRPGTFRVFVRNWFSTLQATALRTPTRGMVLELLLDAPLLGYGFWGCRSAWRPGLRRRTGPDILILVILAALILCWLLCGVYLLTLPLTLCTACILRDADLGQKRWICVVSAAAGVCWYLIIQYAASALPLTAGLLERIR